MRETAVVQLQRRVNLGLLLVFLVLLVIINTTTALSTAAIDTLDMSRIARLQNKEEKRPQVSFSHVHLYVDNLKDLEVYKDLEERLNGLANDCGEVPLGKDIPAQRALWQDRYKPDHFETLLSSEESAAFVPQNRDLVQQLLAGFGFRVTGSRYPKATDAHDRGSTTRSVLVTSKDLSGVQYLLTAKDDTRATTSGGTEAKGRSGKYHHFDAGKLLDEVLLRAVSSY